jgi:hypothetical protein
MQQDDGGSCAVVPGKPENRKLEIQSMDDLITGLK